MYQVRTYKKYVNIYNINNIYIYTYIEHQLRPEQVHCIWHSATI